MTNQNFLLEPMFDARTEMGDALDAIAEGHAIEAAEDWGCTPAEASAMQARFVRASSRFPVAPAPRSCPDCEALPF